MALSVSLVLACALFSKAYPLQCVECIPTGPEPCTPAQVTCPAKLTRCASMTVANFVGGQKTLEITMKTCEAPTECVSGSLSLQDERTTVNIYCCGTDLCHNQDPPALTDNSPNGKQCFECVENNCTFTQKCRGIEDHCITISATDRNKTQTHKGCASQTVCSGILRDKVGLGTGLDIYCCKGNLCNNGLPVEQSFLLLLVSLASFILLY
ncbi:hypothetical protein MATL_G00183200 [Megalops atlanticus]|uniref:UPAR/Ly6 domain-containing protein n=1 Tax=Megalops atlanticus TaxID=7932 RepID=A0A9D3PQ12_MEGAT|nr:hypothetical protein MATL_G00183200 [Megalops atlanticus]